MGILFILFEHAAGYALFKVKEFEEAGMLLPQVEASVTDLKRFNAVVKLVAFTPFQTSVIALENINSISEGILPEALKLFIETHLSKGGKEGKVILGVSEPKLGSSITESLGITCQTMGTIPEILRGIRFHFSNLVKCINSESSGLAQLGLGHSYSRAKVKFNVNRVDNMIIHSIALLDQLDKDINTFSMRIREWYSYHFPELIRIVPDNYTYTKAVHYIKNCKDLNEEKLAGLEEIVMDRNKVEAILEASRSTMGMDISPIDLINIELFAVRVMALVEYRLKLAEYLHTKMNDVAPNLATLVGDQVGARLIAHAGSLTNLAKYPASTVQILGAEKALFRALKTRSNTPKYGLLFHSTFIGRAATKNKGRISRYLANKCSIASRIDCFSEQLNTVFGESLRQQVEDRLKFYECGEFPRKNVDVMKEAVVESARVQAAILSANKKKMNNKRSSSNMEELVQNDVIGVSDEPVKNKKKKKKNKNKKSKKE